LCLSLVSPKVAFLLPCFGTVFLLGLSLDPKGVLVCCCLEGIEELVTI
jgi:hypothetical protein